MDPSSYTPNGHQDPGPAAAGSRGRWIGAFAAIVLLTEQTALGFQLIAPALIGYAAKYHTTQIVWMITIWALAGGVATPVAGKLADQYGKRKVLLGAAAIAIVGGIICATAPSFEIMLMGRALMGASYVFLPLSFPLIRDVFPSNYRAMCITIASNGVGVVAILGPFIAGLLIDHVSYSSVFWFVTILTALGSIGIIALVPETKVRNPSRIDIVGVITFTVGFLLLMLAFSEMPTWGASDARTIAALVGGAVVLVGWWAWEHRTAEPFIPPQLLSRRPMAPVLFCYAFIGGAATVTGAYLPELLQTPRSLGIDYGFGLSATGVAGVVVFGGIMTVAVGVIVGWLGPRYGYRPFLIIAPVFGVIGSLGIGLFRSSLWMPIVFYAAIGTAYMAIAAGTALVMVVSPVRYRGVAAGMLSALGGAIGSLFATIAGMVLNDHIRHMVSGQPFYTGNGVALAFVIPAGLCAAAIVFALLAPSKKEAEQADPDAVPTDVVRIGAAEI